MKVGMRVVDYHSLHTPSSASSAPCPRYRDFPSVVSSPACGGILPPVKGPISRSKHTRPNDGVTVAGLELVPWIHVEAQASPASQNDWIQDDCFVVGRCCLQSL